MVARTPPHPPAARLGREQWEGAALDAIEEGGLAAVAVEPLARRLGVTKGSFYWHFASRDELLAAALLRWERIHTTERLAALGAVSDPAQRLRSLFEQALTLRPSIIVQLLAAGDDPVVAPTMQRAAAARIGFLAAAYRELGLPRARAQRQALLAYSAYLGLAHIQRDTPEHFGTPRAVTAYLRHVCDALIPGQRA